MRKLRSKGRMVLCALILLACLLPVYQQHNLIAFAKLIMAEANDRTGIETTDTLIVVVPLTLVPLSALALLLGSALCIPARRIYTVLPFLFLLFSVAVLFMSERPNLEGNSVFLIFGNIRIGFYLALLSAMLLPFTKNTRRKRHRRRRSVEDAVPA